MDNKDNKKNDVNDLEEKDINLNDDIDDKIESLNNDTHNFRKRRRHYLFYNGIILGLSVAIVFAVLLSFYFFFNNGNPNRYTNSYAKADEPTITENSKTIELTIPGNNYFAIIEYKKHIDSDGIKYDGFYLNKDSLKDFYLNYFLKEMFHGPEIVTLKTIYIDPPNMGPDSLGTYTPYEDVIRLNPTNVFATSIDTVTQQEREQDIEYVMQHEYMHHLFNTYYKNYNNKSDNRINSKNYYYDGKKVKNLFDEGWNKESINEYLNDRKFNSSNNIVSNFQNANKDKYSNWYDAFNGYLENKNNDIPDVNDLNPKMTLANQPTSLMGSSLMSMVNSSDSTFSDVDKMANLFNNNSSAELEISSDFDNSAIASYPWNNMLYALDYDEALVRDYTQMALCDPLAVSNNGISPDSYAGVPSRVNGFYEDYAIRYNYLGSIYNYFDYKQNSETLQLYRDLLKQMNYGAPISFLNRNNNNYFFGGYTNVKYDWVVFDKGGKDHLTSYKDYTKLNYSDIFNNLNIKNNLKATTKTTTPKNADINKVHRTDDLFAYQSQPFLSGDQSGYMYFVKNTTNSSEPNSHDLIKKVALGNNNWNGNNYLNFNGDGRWFFQNRIYKTSVGNIIHFENEDHGNIVELVV